jgi:acyl-CoA reductase-like NAD-dependent aldehyde dehydrogenase
MSVSVADGCVWTVADRVAWLARFRALVQHHSDELCGLIENEVHKPRWQALTGDVLPLLAACRWLERAAPGLLTPRKARGGPIWLLGVRAQVRRAPLGRVGIIATWNYPVQLLGIELIQALVAGNEVVVKPSEHAPRTQRRLLELAVDAGTPPGVLTWTEATRQAGPKLLDGSLSGPLDHVVFTGSTKVGREIASWAAGTLTPTTLELSGRDSALVLEDADVELAARTIWNAVEMNGGQTCLAPRRALVHRRAYAPFLRALGLSASGARPVRLISEVAAERCWALASDALAHGARSVSGVVEPNRGATIRPIALADCHADLQAVRGEHFGPLLAVVPVASLDEALAVHGSCDQRLATSVFSRDVRAARALAERLGSVCVTINDCVLPQMHPATSIGGIGASGWGLTRGPEGLLAMTRPVYVSTTSSRLRLPTGEPDANALSGLGRLTKWLYAGGGRERSPRTPRLGPTLTAEPNPPGPHNGHNGHNGDNGHHERHPALPQTPSRPETNARGAHCPPAQAGPA